MPVEVKPLFRPDVLRPYLKGFTWPPKNLGEIVSKVDKWATLFSSRRAEAFKERELLPDFLTDIFCDVLGYTRPADNETRYTFSREKFLEVDGKYADAVLGHFSLEKKRYVVALEGKGPSDPLDRPHAGRKMSAVDQGYRYAINLPTDWIIVTSMRETRLYHKGSNQYTYERFDIERLADDPNLFKRFVYLLGVERVCPASGECHFETLLRSSEKVGKELTRDFYYQYANMRLLAFSQLCQENQDQSRFELLAATQKLLDRILFVAFCEDRELLPQASIKQAYEHRNPYDPRPIWDNFRGLFRSIDTGNAGLNIPAYNGGLFAPDAFLDNLNLSDVICGYFRDLAEYDYRPSNAIVYDVETAGKLIDVDILGHIFEQSITDLEQIRIELDRGALPTPNTQEKSRRKKEGAFYTPAFITRYIVEQTLGGAIRERLELLRAKHQSESKGTAHSVLYDPSVYDNSAINEPQRKALIAFWEAWQDELKTIRVLDPACGSGAFLIEAFDQLHSVYQTSNDHLEELRGSRSLFDPDRQILQHNLYGVDLNDEAIDICRLSLWIKTAALGKILTSLDHTVRVGNSVVTEVSVHPRAFDWKAAFPEVFEQGGFDVVVGNPPYIRQEWLAPFKPHWKGKFKTYDSIADIFTYFFEEGLNHLRANGRLGYITSGSWVRGSFGAPLRKFLIETATIESMVDFGEYQPFDDAEMIRPTIVILRKSPANEPMKLFKFLTNGSPPENLSDVIEKAPRITTFHLGAEAWELDPDNVRALRLKLSKKSARLKDIAGAFYNGIKTGLDEAFVISETEAQKLLKNDPISAELLRPIVQGTHMRSWYIEDSQQFLIAIKSSANHKWPWSDCGNEAELKFSKTYPAIYQHLNSRRSAIEKRSDQGLYWWELRSCAYWDIFEGRTIVWPDITNRPRFSFLEPNTTIGMTGFVLKSNDPFLLGLLSSWTTWFFLSKTAQPLRLRSNRWQYRLKGQYMASIPVPTATTSERNAIGRLAEACHEISKERYKLETHVQRRITQVFGQTNQGSLNEKAQDWWSHSLNELGDALKSSFRLKSNPFNKPQTADEWDDYLSKNRQAHVSFSQQIASAETEINERVYRLFELTPAEVELLQREVEH